MPREVSVDAGDSEIELSVPKRRRHCSAMIKTNVIGTATLAGPVMARSSPLHSIPSPLDAGLAWRDFSVSIDLSCSRAIKRALDVFLKSSDGTVVHSLLFLPFDVKFCEPEIIKVSSTNNTFA